MGKMLVIAEKPSLAKNIMNAIGINSFTCKDGYYENDEYIVSWAFGHLLALIDIEDYESCPPRKSKYSWTMEGLPFFPEEFEFQLRKDRKSGKIDSGVRKQFKVLQVLIKRKDVGVVVHAGDADREGEVIIRNILLQVKNKKPVKRLWLPEQTEQTIRRGLSHLESDSKYDSLYNEGLARTYIDWLYGVNLTRLATLKSKSFLRVGRVIVPIVTAIYDRDMDIKTFKPEPYLALISREKTKGIEIQLTSKRKFSADSLDEAAKLCRQYNRAGGVVSDVKKEIKEIPPGKLYSLSKLQGFLGKKYRMTPAESMKVIQKLYENGYITYPRTNTEYLATAEQKKINEMIQQLRKLGHKVEPKNGAKNIYDDSKIESHSALTPTYRMPETDRLTDKEKLVYEAILRRFLAVFSEVPCKVERTKITINVGVPEDPENGEKPRSDGKPLTDENPEISEQFVIKGDVYLQRGWKDFENEKTEDKELPPLSVGDPIVIKFCPVAKETKPPNHYTVDSLNQYLKNPFKKSAGMDKFSEEDELTETDAGTDTGNSADTGAIADAEYEDYKAIFEGLELGTEATRTGIIENAIKSGYISLKKGREKYGTLNYYIEPKGIEMVEALNKLGINLGKEKTAELGRALKKIYRNEMTVEQGVDLAKREIEEIFRKCEGIDL